MKMNFKAIASLTLSATALLFTSCKSDVDSSGLEYMPDMYRSAAIEPYVDYGQIKERINPELTMTRSALIPAFGTIPFHGTNSEEVALYLPFAYLPNEAFKLSHDLQGFNFTKEDTYASAAAMTTNPLKLTDANAEAIFAEGKKLFTANCAQCHGEKGDGKGQMVTNRIYEGVPDYADKKELSNGQIFYSIYYGKGAMGSHASILNKKEIWTLVHYVRKFQNADYGKAASEVAEAVADSTSNN